MHKMVIFMNEMHNFCENGLKIYTLRFRTLFFSYLIIISGGETVEEERTFGFRLCQLRKKNGITQKDLAQKLGVHITTIKNWEGGNCYPDAKNICALADLLHVSADSLLGREEGATVSLAEAPPVLRKIIRQVIQVMIDGYYSIENK